jgi:hypothetical protein
MEMKGVQRLRVAMNWSSANCHAHMEEAPAWSQLHYLVLIEYPIKLTDVANFSRHDHIVQCFHDLLTLNLII